MKRIETKIKAQQGNKADKKRIYNFDEARRPTDIISEHNATYHETRMGGEG